MNFSSDFCPRVDITGQGRQLKSLQARRNIGGRLGFVPNVFWQLPSPYYNQGGGRLYPRYYRDVPTYSETIPPGLLWRESVIRPLVSRGLTGWSKISSIVTPSINRVTNTIHLRPVAKLVVSEMNNKKAALFWPPKTEIFSSVYSKTTWMEKQSIVNSWLNLYFNFTSLNFHNIFIKSKSSIDSKIEKNLVRSWLCVSQMRLYRGFVLVQKKKVK